RARSLELHDSRDLVLGSLGHIVGALVGREIVEREVDVVTARADQIERVRVRDATVGRQIVVDLNDGGYRLGKKAVACVIDLAVTRTAGCIVGAAVGIIGWPRGGAEIAREQLARHQAGAARCTPDAGAGTDPLLNRAREKSIEVGTTAREWHTADNVV